MRSRFHGYGISKQHCVWCGPEDYEQGFKDMIARGTQTTAADYFLATRDERFINYQSVAAMQGHIVTADALKSLTTEELITTILPPGAVQRVSEWLATPAGQELLAAGCPFTFDLDHHPEFSNGGLAFPCQLTHGTVIQAQNVQALPDSQPPDGTDEDPSIGIGSC